MKKTILILFVTLGLTEVMNAQKITKATQQKTFGGMGGIFMKYTLGFKNKTADSIVIDSVKTIADKSLISISFNKTEKAYCEFVFSYALVAAAKCKTCPDATPKQANLTKGIIVYYKSGGKKHSFKVKKFIQLEDLRLP